MQRRARQLPATEDELEGTAAHWVAMRYAAGYGHELPVGAKFISQGREWTVDLDMIVGATMYAKACGGVHSHLRLEDPVKASAIHPEHCYGTPDAWIYYPDARNALNAVLANGTWEVPRDFPLEEYNAGRIKLVRVVDYKYGHRFVEVFGNYQLVAYAQGVLERLELDDNDDNLWLELILVQPRCYHRDGPVRRWVIQAHVLRAWLNHARSAAAEALGPNPRAITNDSCIDCKARYACTVKQRCAQALVEFSGSAEFHELPPTAVGQELALIEDAIARLEARYSGLKVHAEHLIRTGNAVAFYSMKPGESRLIYKDDANIDELVGMADLFGVDIRKPETKKDKLITPTQAIAKGIDELTMHSYAHRPPAALKLTRDSSITAHKVFSK
jgi:hypothetical protein